MLSSRGSALCRILILSALFGIVASALWGCGGGGSGGINPSLGGDPVIGKSADTATAKFQVYVKTGQVTVTPLDSTVTKSASRAVFTGSAVHFNSSVLLDQPGDVGRKVLNVSLTNASGEPIGQLPDGTAAGVKVLFSSFNNVSAFSDPRPTVNVSTVAGSGAVGTGNGSAASSTFNFPSQAVPDAAGNIYVADNTGNVIRKISGGLVTTVAGNGTASSLDGFGTFATLNAPRGIAINPVDGSLIVTEYQGNRIRRITPDGHVTLVAGVGPAIEANGPGNNSYFNNPLGVAVDSNGVIYVVDVGGNTIRRITGSGISAANYNVTTLAGSGTAARVDGVGTGASFKTPAGITLGSDGALYVTELGSSSIRRVTTNGEVVTIGGTGSPGSANGSAETATFNSPIGIVSVGGALIVSEASNATLRQIRLKEPGAAATRAENWYVQLLAGAVTSTGSANGDGTVARFNSPQMMGASPSGAIYLADQVNQRIRKITPTSGFFPVGVATGSNPTEPVQLSNADGVIPSSKNLPFMAYSGALAAGSSSSAKPWVFTIPSGVSAFEFSVTVEANTSFLASPESVSNPGPTGAGSPNVTVRTLAGIPGQFGFVDGIAAASLFGSFIGGMSVDGAGNVYVTDFHNNAIRRIGANGIVSTVAGVLGVGGGSPVDGPGTVAKFNGPVGIAVTADGKTIYVGDANNNRIRRISIQSGADPATAANWFVATIAGTGTQSAVDGSGAVATMVLPEGVAIDPGGNLYFSENAGNRIRRMQFTGGDPNTAANWQVRLLAGDNSTPFPATGSTDGRGTAARFADPTQIACDRAGNVIVCDSFNNRIRKVTPDGLVTTVAGTTFGYADGSGGSEKFGQPQGLALDSAGFAFVADNSNQLIRRVSPGGAVTTVAGIAGTSGTVSGAGNVATFTSPFSTAVDSSGNVYAAGTTGEIRMIQRVLSAGSL